MKVEDLETGKTYLIDDLSFCVPCISSPRKCPVVSLTERGFLKDVPVTVVKKQNGMIIFRLETGEFALRIKEINNNLTLKEIV